MAGGGAASPSRESGFVLWHIAKFFCHTKLGRYRGMADIEQALTPFNLAEATD
jgi:hypothetical protein